MTKPIHASQKLLGRNDEDGSCTFQIEVVVNFELYSVMMSYGSGIKIISPRNVSNYMKSQLQKAAGLYDVL